MKELSIEEKAKAYDKAIKKAESLYKVSEPMSGCNVILETLFPELKENEDEKVRKILFEFFKNYKEQDTCGSETFNGIPTDNILAWLEKQGTSYTKKDVDDVYLKGVTDTKKELEKQYESTYQIRKDIATFIFNYRGDIKDRAKWMDYLGIKVSFVEKQGEQKHETPIPRFNIGDWVVQNDLGIYKIVEVCESWYEVISYKDGIQYSIGFDKENDCHLWTIQDARDGDVLAAQECYVIFKEIDGLNIKCHCTYHYTGLNPSFHINTLQNKTAFHPATKEQCDLLFQKMNEAGYEWDANKKKLKEIEKPTDVRTTGYWHVEDVEQKPTDEEMKRLLQTEYEKGRADAIADMQMEWSEEDEKMINHIISIIEDADDNLIRAENISIYTNWLESLENRVQPKQKWSEEDIVHLNNCISFMSRLSASEMNWLKSLRPQNNWKPSDENMKALNYVVNLMASSESPKENDYYYNVFKDLRKQLKKLKEE